MYINGTYAVIATNWKPKCPVGGMGKSEIFKLTIKHTL